MPGDRPWAPVLDAAKAGEASYRRALVAALDTYARNLDVSALESMIAGSWPESRIWDLFEHEEARGELYDATVGMMGDVIQRFWPAGQRAQDAQLRQASSSFKDTGISAGLDLVNEETIDFLETYALDLITGIDAGTREAVRGILLRAARGELTVQQAASLIQGDIGLNARQAVAAENVYREAYEEAIKGGESVAAAEAEAAAKMARYRIAAIRMRAETIARTETLRAANAGQQALWENSLATGLLPKTATKRWIVTPDERLCVAICRPLQDVEVGVEELFDTNVGQLDYPPAHPRCRCAIGIGRLYP